MKRTREDLEQIKKMGSKKEVKLDYLDKESELRLKEEYQTAYFFVDFKEMEEIVTAIKKADKHEKVDVDKLIEVLMDWENEIEYIKLSDEIYLKKEKKKYGGFRLLSKTEGEKAEVDKEARDNLKRLLDKGII